MTLSSFPVRPAIAVSDVGRSARFYEEQPGLPLLRTGPSAEIRDGGRVYGSAAGPALTVFESDTAGASQATLATWYVDGLDAVVDELAGRGVEMLRYDGLSHDVRGITGRAGGGRIAWFRDPDGNTFALEPDD